MFRFDVDRLIAGWRGPALAALFAALAALPGLITVPPLDRDESRFAEATAQMLETRDFVNIQFQDAPRHKKPVGIHWLQAASVAALSRVEARQIWAYRVPSLLGAALAAAACAWGAIGFLGQRGGVLAGVALGSTVLLSTEGFFATTDAVLCGAITLAMAALGRLYGAANGIGTAGFRTRLLFWIGVALSILVKGPIGPLVVGLTLLALALWDRRAAWMKSLGWAWGLALTVLVTAPWAIAITVATDGAFWGRAVGGDMAAKIAGGQESHGAPPGFYMISVLVTLFPATLLLGAAAVTGWRQRAEPGVRFALCWLIPSWIVFEAVPTKLVHYVLPLFGALAWLMAAALQRPLTAAGRWVGVGILALGAVLISAAAVYALSKFGRPADEIWAMLTIGLAVAAAVAGAVLLLRRFAASALLAVCGLGVLAHAALFAGLAAGLTPLWSSRNVLRTLDRNGLDPRDPSSPAPIAFVGYAEPSAVFLTQPKTVLGGPVDGARAIAAGHPAVVEARDDAAFRAALAAAGVKARAVAVDRGFDYSNGRKVALTLYRQAR
jgi:4-amino-4-deoxy-L-arabinose transferase-like glycosyltransferase